jgi:hypothetical protein
MDADTDRGPICPVCRARMRLLLFLRKHWSCQAVGCSNVMPYAVGLEILKLEDRAVREAAAAETQAALDKAGADELGFLVLVSGD